MTNYDGITVEECILAHMTVGVTFDLNAGHVTAINTEEEAE